MLQKEVSKPKTRQESIYRGVCDLRPGVSCRYESEWHAYTRNPVDVGEPILHWSGETIVPIIGPDDGRYWFKADHEEQTAYQRHAGSDWNEILKLEIIL